MGNMNFCPVLNDTIAHYAEEDRQDRKQDAIYGEATRLVAEEIGTVLDHLYGGAMPKLHLFESALSKIGRAWSSKEQQLAADELSEILHETAMEIARKGYGHGMD